MAKKTTKTAKASSVKKKKVAPPVKAVKPAKTAAGRKNTGKQVVKKSSSNKSKSTVVTKAPAAGKSKGKSHTTPNSGSPASLAQAAAKGKPVKVSPVRPKREPVISYVTSHLTGPEAERRKLVVEAVDRGAPLTPEELLKADSGLTSEDVEHYKHLLLEKRAELLGDVASLKADLEHDGDLSNLPMHMADVGSDHYQQEFTLGLMESERRTLREIEDALMRLSKGYFGVCVDTGLPIGKARLEVKPWAKYCIDIIRERERRGLA
ncbi:MAG: TraR/DksA family transcriptional regulator [Phycisphaeraceae bacterium]|nr:TraR/DksA family transcriptional regulator [Phycisphaeraceae bacterium]